jgi:hypothetical protein
MLVSSITATEPHYSKYGTSEPTIVRLTYWETQVPIIYGARHLVTAPLDSGQIRLRKFGKGTNTSGD